MRKKRILPVRAFTPAGRVLSVLRSRKCSARRRTFRGRRSVSPEAPDPVQEGILPDIGRHIAAHLIGYRPVMGQLLQDRGLQLFDAHLLIGSGEIERLRRPCFRCRCSAPRRFLPCGRPRSVFRFRLRFRLRRPDRLEPCRAPALRDQDLAVTGAEMEAQPAVFGRERAAV